MKILKYIFIVFLFSFFFACQSQNNNEVIGKKTHKNDSYVKEKENKSVCFYNNSSILKAGFVRMPLYEKSEFNIFISNDKKYNNVNLDQEAEFFYSGDTHIPYLLNKGDTIFIKNNIIQTKLSYTLNSNNPEVEERIHIFQEAIKKGIPLFFTEADNQQNKLLSKVKVDNNITEILNYYNSALSFFDSFYKGIDNDFKSFYKEYLKFDSYIKIFTYCTKRSIVDSLFKKNFFNLNTDQNNKYYNSNYAYFGALYQSFLYKYNKNIQKAKPLEIDGFLDSTYGKYQADLIKLFYLKNYGLEILNRNSDEFVQAVQTINSQEYKKYLNNFYLDYSYKKTLRDKISDINNKEYSLKFIINNSSEKLKYIDFWASWCGPCREEFKNYPLLLNQFTTDQVDFITISIDQSVSSWQKALVKENLASRFKNYFYPSPSKENISVFDLTTIPRYIIVNKQGTVVNFNAPRPSDTSLIPMLRNLLLK